MINRSRPYKYPAVANQKMHLLDNFAATKKSQEFPGSLRSHFARRFSKTLKRALPFYECVTSPMPSCSTTIDDLIPRPSGRWL